MKICVFGAGAIGGYLAARLLHAGGHEVAVVARNEQLRAIASAGLALLAPDEEILVRPHAVTDRPAELPPQDLVFVTLKAHSQPAAARDIAALLAPGATAVFVNNGIPWWWEWRGPERAAMPLPLLDPQGALWRHVGPQRALGCVVYSANEVVRPGVVRHAANNRWLLGEPDGRMSRRLATVAEAMRGAGVNAEEVADIRARVWLKLLRNAPLNTICALTRLSVDELGSDPRLAELCCAVIDEITAIAAAEGVDLSQDVASAKAVTRLGGAIDGTRARGIRPSMLQDVLSGRSTEVDAILGQVQLFARASGTPSPVIDVLLPLVHGLERGLTGTVPEAAMKPAESG